MNFLKVLKEYKYYFILILCLIVLSVGTIVYADKISDLQDDIADILNP